MSDGRKKVKDLAAELGLPARDVLAAAREIGVTSAKVAASSLSEVDVSRLRGHFSPPAVPDKQEVIVRRRPRQDTRSASPQPSASVVEETAAQAPAERTAGEPAALQPEQPPLVPEEKKSARIIRRPGEAPPPAVPPQEIPESSAEETPAPEIAATLETAETPPEAPETPPARKTARGARPAAFSAEPERNARGQTVSSAPMLTHKGDPGETGFDDSGPGRAGGDRSSVRIISRPDAGKPRDTRQDTRAPGNYRPRTDSARLSRAGGQGTDARPGGPRPGGPRPAAAGFLPPGAPSDGEQSRKRRQKGRRTVDFAELRERSGGDADVGWNKTSRRSKPKRSREAAPLGGTQPVKAVKRKIKVDEVIRVSDLARQMQIKSSEIIRILFTLGSMATINQSLDIDTATVVAAEFGYEIEKVGFNELDHLMPGQEEDNPEDLVVRPPVVTIMGHVDHGKTSLLDAIRKSSVAMGEAGGITQHIGAYHVSTKKGEIVFLDTPGHEAFTAMRARGAEVTDIVVLVVAADDGVMEQTREAINHAKAAGVPIMVAMNKMDKEGANPDRVKRELAEQGLVAEDWGGDTTFSPVSAKTRQGLDELLELLALQAEILALTANPKKPARGHIVEAKLDKGRGSLGTVLIQEGTLHLGDAFVCGVHSGRVRAMFNDQGKKVEEAGPSIPVEVQGFEGVPEAGEEFTCLADEKIARRIAETRALKLRDRELARESKLTLETFLAQRPDSVDAQVLNLVVKCDVQGSLEAIAEALHKLSTDKVRINVIHGGAGAISESDVLLATASRAIIIGFNVRPAAKAKELAERDKVDIRFYDVIYKLVEEIKGAMEGMLSPVSREVFLGSAEVREIFSVPKAGTVAGCHIAEGKVLRNAQIRLLRDGIVVHTGKIASLRRFKDDVREVLKGYDCGISLDHYNDVKAGDMIEAFEMVEEAATL